jgi:hypothetical protein
MPSIYDCTTPERALEKESPLKEFLRSCLALMKYEISLNALRGMIDHCTMKGTSYNVEGSEPGTAQKEDERQVQIKFADWEL